MSEHTPGPWVVYPETDGIEVCAVSLQPGLPVRAIVCQLSLDNFIPNGHLIAAAPDLLAACKEMAYLLDNFENACELGEQEVIRAKAAIAKAEGK